MHRSLNPPVLSDAKKRNLLSSPVLRQKSRGDAPAMKKHEFGSAAIVPRGREKKVERRVKRK